MQKQSIFISYSHQDETYKDLVIKFLKSANMPGSFKAWSDRDIEIGSQWETEICSAIDHAKAAIFLISENFLSSDFIRTKEVPLLLNRCKTDQICVYPILIKSCPWTEHEWLSQTQMLPRDGKSIEKMNAGDRSDALTTIVLDIKKLLFPEQCSNQSESNDTTDQRTNLRPKNRIRELIYYTMDRREQREPIEDFCHECAHQQPSPSFAWIFHGDDHHCLDEFFDLLKLVWLPEYLHPNPLIISINDWPQTASNDQAIENKILRNIYREYISNEMRFQSDISFENISKQLNQHKGPVIIKCLIYANQWQHNSKENIERFLNIFQKWPDRYNGAFIVILMIVYLDRKQPQQRKKGIFKRWSRKNKPDDPNRAIRESLASIPFETFNYTQTVLFDEFSLIQYSDVKHWAKDKAVTNRMNEDQLNDVIDQLYPDQQMALPMKHLAKELKQKLDPKGNHS